MIHSTYTFDYTLLGEGSAMTDSHEVYPNAPLALVAVEVRFPVSSAERPLPMPIQRSFRDLLGEDWVIESHKVQQLSLIHI